MDRGYTIKSLFYCKAQKKVGPSAVALQALEETEPLAWQNGIQMAAVGPRARCLLLNLSFLACQMKPTRQTWEATSVGSHEMAPGEGDFI